MKERGAPQHLRRESYNRAALRAATQLLPDGATIEIFELDGIPGFNQNAMTAGLRGPALLKDSYERT